MNVTQALALLKEFHVRPGVSVYGSRVGPGRISIRIIHHQVPDYSPWQARQGYPARVSPYTDWPLDVYKLNTQSEFFDAVTRRYLAAEIHELREGVRIGPDFHAPYHPHRIEGELAFRRMAADGLDHGCDGELLEQLDGTAGYEKFRAA